MFIEKQSQWAFEHCLKLKREGKEDTDEVWRLIKTNRCAFEYCKNVEEKPEVLKYIKDNLAYNYCLEVNDHPLVWKNINYSYSASKYCIDVKNRPEVRKFIYEEEAVYYCKDIKDDPEVRKRIISPKNAFRYIELVRDRKEMFDIIKKDDLFLSKYLVFKCERKELTFNKDKNSFELSFESNGRPLQKSGIPVSCWAYSECANGNNTKENRRLITNSHYASMYCLYINEDPKLLKRIKNIYDIIYFCKHNGKNDRNELWRNIKNDKDKVKYLSDVQFIEDLYNNIDYLKLNYFEKQNYENLLNKFKEIIKQDSLV